MTGQKARSGGKRPGAGRHRQRFYIDKEAAHELFLILQHRRMLQPHLTEEQVLARLIYDAWQEIDEQYQQAAKMEEECQH